jgi:vacuolar protein sorting-associated protein 11
MQQANITCVATGSDNVFFGSADGYVRILSQAFKIVRSFKAHDVGSITHMKQVQGTSLLVTIAEDLSNEPLLKVWALDKLEKKTGIPRCQCTISIHNGRKQFPVCLISPHQATRKTDGARYPPLLLWKICLSLRSDLRMAL